jgi:hypothetical protein
MAAWHRPGKRKYNETGALVVEAFDRNRKLNSVQLGEMLGLHPAYIRKALSRNGRKLAKKRRLTPITR